MEKDPIYFLQCGASGAIAACATHQIMIPIDVAKTRMQLSPLLYPNLKNTFRKIRMEEGLRAWMLGGGPTTWGYLLQGFGKYGLYELFKHKLANICPEFAKDHSSLIYLSAGMTAEAIADVGLAPFEAARIKRVADPSYARSTITLLSRLRREKGVLRGWYTGLGPLWMKQIPYTAVKLTVFEQCEHLIYSRVNRDGLCKLQQLSVTAVSGFVGGVVSAVASHPADTLLTRVNSGGWKSVFKQGMGNWTAGLASRMGMVGTLGMLQLLAYDSCKVFLFGLPTSYGIKPILLKI